MLPCRLVRIGKTLRYLWRVSRLRFFTNSEAKAAYYRKLGFRVGTGCRIYPILPMSEPGIVEIGNHVTITQGVMLVTHDGATWVLRGKYPGHGKPGPITIRDNCFIGVNSIILPGVTIGPDSIVGAGAVVTKDVPPRTVAAGNPCRVLMTLERYEAKCLADPAFRRWDSFADIYRYFGVENDKDPS
jgi:acetyltransferase-like isoleucine patch superfamily enzyme